MYESPRTFIDTQQRVLRLVLDERVLVSGLVPIDDRTWAIYGSIPVDGQVILAEFGDRADAESVLEQIDAADQDHDAVMAKPSGIVFNTSH